MTNSRDKGKRIERAWAKELTDAGFPARRGQQYNGIEGEDVVCPSLSRFHCEVKGVERLNIHNAMKQATQDAGEKIPYVAHKKNREEWLVTMRARGWMELLNA